MAFFSLRGLSVAQTESAGEIRDWSIRSNEFAAKLAAQSIESEFANLFQELGQVVNESFRKKLNRVLTDAGDTTLRSLAVETAPEDIIAKIRSLPSQDDLQDHLKRTLQKWMSEKRISPTPPSSVVSSSSMPTEPISPSRSTKPWMRIRSVGILLIEPIQRIS